MNQYEIITPDGSVYEVTAASQEQADQIGAWIQQRVAAGDRALKNEEAPFNATIADPEQLDRSGFFTDVDAFMRGAARSISGNYADEIAGFLNSGLGLGETDFGQSLGLSTIDEATNYQRAIDAADDSQNALASNTGKGVGAALQALLGARLLGLAAPEAAAGLAAAGRTHPVLTAAGAGIPAAAMSGAFAGSGEGTTLAERDKNARMGGFAGGAVATVLGPGVAVTAPAVARYASVMMGRLPEKEAIRQIIQSLSRDGYDVTSPSGVQALKTELQRFSGKPVSLADIGNATRARAGVGLRAPSDVQSRAIDQVLERQAGQGRRLEADVRQNVAPRTDVHALNENLVKQREEAALPLLDEALFERTHNGGPLEGFGNPQLVRPQLELSENVSQEGADAGMRRMLGMGEPTTLPSYQPAPVTDIIQDVARQARIPDDPVLQGLARLPLAQRGLQSSRGLAEAERARLALTGQDISHLPDNSPGQNLDMRSLHYLKQFLDREVNALKRGQGTDTFKSAEFHEVMQLRNAIRERMRAVGETSPGAGDGPYAGFLDNYSGVSDMIDALDSGRGFNKLDPEQIAAEQAGRTGAEQELYRVGVARKLTDTITDTTDGRSPALRILKNDDDRLQLAATGVAPDNAQALNTAVQQERQLSRLPAELQGAQTQQRLAAAQDADTGVSGALPFNPTQPTGWAGMFFRKLVEGARQQRNAAVNEQIMPRLLEQDPSAINRIIDELHAQGNHAEALRVQREYWSRIALGAVGNRLGTESAVTEGY